jgi:hypothetical protein
MTYVLYTVYNDSKMDSKNNKGDKLLSMSIIRSSKDNNPAEMKPLMSSDDDSGPSDPYAGSGYNMTNNSQYSDPNTFFSPPQY